MSRSFDLITGYSDAFGEGLDDFSFPTQQDNFASAMMQPTTPVKSRGSIDMAAFPPPVDFFNMSDLKFDIPAGNGGYDFANDSPMTKASSTISSFQSSPEMGHMSLFGNLDTNADTMAARLLRLAESPSPPDLSNNFNNSNISDYSNHSSPAKGHAYSRSQSVSEAEDLEKFVTDTGITVDEIASFISGPDADNRWKCLYAGCARTFGRKENIKSHVQTHLGDRHYCCKQCDRKFVRQHDLKRHANIHTNNKMYTCPCSKEFARHDALTRHRQRGMCIGAFDGTPKKQVKRGRPKKSRPETEERLEKAAATRQRVLERIAPFSPSTSAASSPHAQPMSRQQSNASSFYGTPPELELSSSPLAPSVGLSATDFLAQPSPDCFRPPGEIIGSELKDFDPPAVMFSSMDDFDLFGPDDPANWLSDL